MKDFLKIVIIASLGGILFEASTGNGFCMGNQPKVGNNSTCSNRTDFQTGLCRMQCLFCKFREVSQPFGCLSRDNGTCQCIGRPRNNRTRTDMIQNAPLAVSFGDDDEEDDQDDDPSSASSFAGGRHGLLLG